MNARKDAPRSAEQLPLEHFGEEAHPGGHLTQAQLALVHVARARLGLDEIEYRDLLEAAAGVRSARDMDQEQFTALMHRLERLGFKAQAPRARIGMATPAQVSYIRAMWQRWRGEPDPKGLRTWLGRRFGIADPRRLTREMAHQTLVALKAMNARKA